MSYDLEQLLLLAASVAFILAGRSFTMERGKELLHKLTHGGRL